MALRPGVLMALAWLAAACASTAIHRASPRAPEPGDVPATHVASGGADSEHASKGGAPQADSSASSAVSDDAASSFDLDVWARDHGVVVELNVDGCESAHLGDQPDRTLWCFRHEEQPGARVLYFRALYVLVGQRLVRVMELPTAAGPFATEGQASSPRTVELVAKVASDGQSVDLDEVSGRTCADARAANDKALVDEPLGGPGFVKLVDRVCAARGRYRWRSGTLNKER